MKYRLIRLTFMAIFILFQNMANLRLQASESEIVSVCHLLRNNQVSPDTFRLPLKYRHYGEPWRIQPNAKLFSIAQLDANFGALLSQTVQGTNSTAKEILKVLHSNHCLPFIWGGAMRDMVRGVQPNDIDLAVTCSPSHLKRICLEWWGASNCHRPHPGSLKLSIGNPRASKGPIAQVTEPMDIAHWNNSFEANNGIFWEFSVDTLAFYLAKPWEPIGNVLIDLSGNAVDDVCGRRIRIPTSKENWDDWAAENPPLKLLRHWTLRAKGFWSDLETRQFIIGKTRRFIRELDLERFFCYKILEGQFSESEQPRRNNTAHFQHQCQHQQRSKSHPFVREFARLFVNDMDKEFWPKLKEILDEDQKTF